MLHFGAKPPFTSEKFINMCKDFIPSEDLEMARNTEGWPKWQEFDTQLRNELVKIRAAKKRVDPVTYLRHGGSVELSVMHIALAATRNPSIIEAERVLDQERWHFLDELSIGHYFDIDFLIIYAIKLKILERWAKINSSDPAQEVRQLC